MACCPLRDGNVAPWAGTISRPRLACYGIVLLAAALAYYGLQKAIIRDQGTRSVVATAVGRHVKGKLSPLLYAAGIGLSFVNHWPAVTIHVGVALMWLIPDRRLEAPSPASRHQPGPARE
jgi:uncharacterized membrane protein